MSKRSDAKKARRRKRQAVRGATWIPDPVHEPDAEQRVAEIIAELENFDAKLTERGWVSNAEVDAEAGVIWFWPPSYAEVDDAELATATVVALIEAEGGEIAHVVFVGSDDDYQFNLEELFDHINVVEAYRIGDPPPVFA
ncbi:MAG: hypothetical protein AB7G47_01225 [Mycolicibacterium sp.]|uniref:hypothetical protein n=1 Tax=Mycolicibacterium sp. TaxID=2320850 RepID=UPI003D0B89EA